MPAAWATDLLLAKSWEPHITSAVNVPGWTTNVQHRNYEDLVNILPKNPKVLEIGCGWGRSTWAWLDVLPDTTEYHILDNFSMPYWALRKSVFMVRANINYKQLKRIYKQNIAQREIFDVIIKQHPKQHLIKKVWHMPGEEWKSCEDYTTEWDLVYLDDDHSYLTVNNWLERFTNVPIVCGDDYHPSHAGVVSAVDEYDKNTDFTKQILPGNFWVIKNT